MKQPEHHNNKEENDSGPGWASYLGLGTQLAITVTAMTFLGVWLDKKYNTQPILTIICSLFGVTAGMYNFIKTVLKSR